MANLKNRGHGFLVVVNYIASLVQHAQVQLMNIANLQFFVHRIVEVYAYNTISIS